MTKLVDPDSLNQGTEVVISTAGKTVQLLVAGNLDDNSPGATSGVTMQAVYSFLKEEWKNDNALNKFKFPLQAFTKNEFQWINGWAPADAQTRQLLRDAGWQETVGTENGDLWAGMISLGAFNAAADQGYYQQVTGFDQSTTNFDKTGEVNEAVLVYDASGGPADYTGFFKAFLREQGKLYDSYDLLTEQGLTALEATLYRFPLSNSSDLNISSSDAYIDLSSAVTFTNGTDLVNLTSHPLSNNDAVRFTNSGGALPAEISTGTTYYVINANANDFQISTTVGGSAVDFTDDGTGTHTVVSWPYDGMDIAYLSGVGFTSWTISTVYPAESVVQDAAGRWWFTDAGGTSAGNDTDLGGGSDTGVTWVAYEGERLIGSNYYAFNRIVDGSSGTRFQIYDWMQRQLRKTTDINTGVITDANQDTIGTVNGNVADELSAFRGSDLILEQGVYIDSFAATEINNLVFVPIPVDGGAEAEVTFPFEVVVTLNFSQNIIDETDADTRGVAYFTNNDAGDDDGSDFDTASAIIVQDNTPANVDIDGTDIVGGAYTFSYDYDGNVQRGAASASSDAPVTLQMVGLAGFVVGTTEFTITRQATLGVNVSAGDERNYSNP